MHQKSECPECVVNNCEYTPEILDEFDQLLEEYGDWEKLYKEQVAKCAEIERQNEAYRETQKGAIKATILKKELASAHRKNKELEEKLQLSQVENNVLRSKAIPKSPGPVTPAPDVPNHLVDSEILRLRKENQSLLTLNRNLKAQLNAHFAQASNGLVGIENEKPILERRSRSVSDDLLCNNNNKIVKRSHQKEAPSKVSSPKLEEVQNTRRDEFSLPTLKSKPTLYRSNSVREMIKIFENASTEPSVKRVASFRIKSRSPTPLRIQNTNYTNGDNHEDLSLIDL